MGVAQRYPRNVGVVHTDRPDAGFVGIVGRVGTGEAVRSRGHIDQPHQDGYLDQGPATPAGFARRGAVEWRWATAMASSKLFIAGGERQRGGAPMPYPQRRLSRWPPTHMMAEK